MNEEANVLLLQDEHDTRTKPSTESSIWKLFIVFLFFMVVSVWIIFNLFPRKKLPYDVTATSNDMPVSSLYDTNCTVLLPQTNRSKQWSGFVEIVPGTLIYSSFYDDIDRTTPFVRMVVISNTFRPTKLFCHSRCDIWKTEVAEIHLVKEHKDKRHAAFIVSCRFPRKLGRDPGFISLSALYDGKMSKPISFPVESTVQSKHVHNYSICVPPIFGEGPSLTHFVEFVEMNRILGVTHLFFYDLQLKPAIRNAMMLYERKGLVTLLPWNLPVYLRDFYSIHYHGQLVSIQDCLYRNRGRAKWTGFFDLDEFIVPLTHPTIPALMNEIHTEGSCGYRIKSIVLPTNAIKITQPENKLLTQQLFTRTKSTFTTRTKCIVNPEKVFEMSIHYIEKPSLSKYKASWIPIDKALVFHYRQCNQFEDLKAACKHLIAENYMEKYRTRLKKHVDQVMKHLQ